MNVETKSVASDITEYINDNYDEEYIVDFVAFDAQKGRGPASLI